MPGGRRTPYQLLCSGVVSLLAFSAGAQSESLADSALIDADAQVEFDPSDQRRGWRFLSMVVYWENDGTYAKPYDDHDRHYTNGVKLDVAFDPGFSQEWRDRIAPPGKWEDPQLAVGFVLAQHMYTGRDIEDPDPPSDDHPYAGYTYIGAYLQRSDDQRLDHFELNIGIVGQDSGAEATQRFIHEYFPSNVEPLGWHTQLANELAIQFMYQRIWRTGVAHVGPFEVDALPQAGFELGNVFTRANADLTVRVGKNLPHDFGPGRMLSMRDATRSWVEHDPARRWGLYAYGRVGGKAVARNIFLDGNTFTSSRSVDKNPFVGEFQVGVVARYRAIEFGYSLTMLTEEFESAPGNDFFASLFLRWVCDF